LLVSSSVPFVIDPSSGIVTVDWEEEGEGEGPDWKTSYSLQVVATDGTQEIVAPLVIRDGYCYTLPHRVCCVEHCCYRTCIMVARL
jgi:hypothetical protein